MFQLEAKWMNENMKIGNYFFFLQNLLYSSFDYTLLDMKYNIVWEKKNIWSKKM